MTTFYNCPVNASGVVETEKWGKHGYLAPYNLSAENLAKEPIAFKFYPSYMTESEVRADLASLPNPVKSFEKGYGITSESRAVILDYPTVTKIPFGKDGTLGGAEYQRTADFIAPANGGVCVKKYDDPQSDNVTGGNDYRDVPVFHVSDMYLIAAEAYLMADNKGEALNKVNAVRKRAKAGELSSFGAYEPMYLGITNVPFAVTELDVILDERARELYAERTRYEDLRRTKQLVRYNVTFSRVTNIANAIRNSKGEYKWLRPIPAVEINFNTSISLEDQNPGY